MSEVSSAIRRAQLERTTSGQEGAALVGTDSKTNLGSATTVEAALETLNTRAAQYASLAATGPGILFQASVGAAITVVASDVDATELGYLNGVTSAIQTQLDAKLPLGGGTMTGYITLHADPSSSMHAATKQYVDALTTNGIKWKAPVSVATTAAGTLASSFENGDTVDGVTLATGNRILIKNQADASENGIYTVAASGAPTRDTDADTYGELNGAVVFVLKGTANADKGFMQTAELTSFAGQVWVQNFGTGLYVADETTLTLSGSTFAVKSGGISNTQVNASAAIALSKLATVTASRALVSDGSGNISASSVTATELGVLSGASGTLVNTTGTQTLTNKTLTSPRIGTAILDTNGNESLEVAATAIAVNHVKFINSVTGVPVTVVAEGDDANIHMWIGAKNSANLTLLGQSIHLANASYILDNNSNELFSVSSTASAVNYISFANSATGTQVDIAAAGDDTNIAIRVKSKGTGGVVLDGEVQPQGWTKHRSTFSTMNLAAYGATVTFDLSISDTQYTELSGNPTLAVSNPKTGQWFRVILIQDAAGSRTITSWWSGIAWAGGSAPTLTTTGDRCDIFEFYCFSSGVYLGRVVAQNYAI